MVRLAVRSAAIFAALTLVEGAMQKRHLSASATVPARFRSTFERMFLGITACLLALASCSGTLPAQSPPNVLFITADDLGLQLGCYGDTVIETPQLDAFAASGVQFDVAYVAQASCSPSRSAMFTGLYVHSTGQYGLTNGTPSPCTPISRTPPSPTSSSAPATELELSANSTSPPALRSSSTTDKRATSMPDR